MNAFYNFFIKKHKMEQLSFLATPLYVYFILYRHSLRQRISGVPSSLKSIGNQM